MRPQKSSRRYQKAILVGCLCATGFSGCVSQRGTNQGLNSLATADSTPLQHSSRVIDRELQPAPPTIPPSESIADSPNPTGILPASFTTDGLPTTDYAPAPAFASTASLAQIEALALDNNPRLNRLYGEYQSAVSRTHAADKLPDPKIAANVFGNPIETASGSQRANLGISQMIPWLEKLNAQQQQACFEALAIRSDYELAQLELLSAVRTTWYQLYLVDRQIEIAKANQEFLENLIAVANARIANNLASQNDVSLGNVELSKLEERIYFFHRQRQTLTAQLNRLTAQSPTHSWTVPTELNVACPTADIDEVVQQVRQSQPELRAAELRAQATRWGIEVARLSRRPEFTLSANYFLTDNNRPPSSVVSVGQDPWSLGVAMTLPVWRDKYDAIENAASWKHSASNNAESELIDRYEAAVVHQLAEARRADETAKLYQSTILPEARRALETDQQAYANSVVEFDRVITDYRNLLTLELEYHKALSELGTAVAQLRQLVGDETLSNSDSPVGPLLRLE